MCFLVLIGEDGRIVDGLKLSCLSVYIYNAKEPAFHLYSREERACRRLSQKAESIL